ncbi:D-alanyl-D-alanine carboxypeptidase family protein [Sulfurivirga caldicuralii]|nr:D-alanyl-D-alanine carboxypeptidase family protein [Sulfurivirga caldicuralii]
MKHLRVLLLFPLLLFVQTGLSAPAHVPAPKPVTEQVSIVPAPPSIAAKAYLLIDFDSGAVLAARDPDKRVEPASLTKMMTSYIVAHELDAGKIHLDDKVTISEKAWKMPGSKMFIEVGKKVPVRDLLKGMIVQSGNDATVALAEYVAGSEEVFAQLMNQYAQKLGMTHTHFVNATGLPDPNHYTTARDLAILARALIREFPNHYDWYKEKVFTYNGITQYNRNKLLWQDPSVDGIKTGHTQSAGYCLVASAKRDGMRLISVVLGTDSDRKRISESRKLLNYGFRFYETHPLYKANQRLTDHRVWEGATDTVAIGTPEDVYITIPRGEYKNVQPMMEIPKELHAPIQKGQQLGTLKVMLHDKVLVEKPLIALNDVQEGGFFKKLMDQVKLLFAQMMESLGL